MSRVLVVVIVFAIGAVAGLGYYGWTFKNQSSTSERQKYTNDEFGFSFLYPSVYTIVALGPNDEAQRLARGEQISGTIPPALETLVFESLRGGEQFRVTVYEAPHQPLNEDYPITGQCGSQFGEPLTVNFSYNIKGRTVIEREQSFGTSGVKLFNCLTTRSGNFLVFEGKAVSYSEIPATVESIE